MVQKSSRIPQIGARLRYWRKDIRRMTLQQLSDVSGSGPAALSRLEKGTEGASLERYERIATALNVPLAALLDGEFFDRMQALEAENAALRRRIKEMQNADGGRSGSKGRGAPSRAG